MDETRITASLPNIDIEMTRRMLPDGAGETVTMVLRATPSLDAAARLMSPYAMMMPLLAANPFLTAWTQAMQQAWAPWAGGLLPGPDRGRDRP